MEVNKEQAEKCRDLGAAALRQGDYPKATKMLQKSLSLYPLPGVEALLTHAKSKLERDENRSTESAPSSMNGDASTTSSSRTSNNGNSNTSSSTQPTTNGADGRAYTTDQVNVVRKVLAAKEGGRGAHYRVLDIASAASEADIKKAYRKLSLKVHPDKNSAPHADEAFKAVGLAYATLSDPQKRTIYDRYGEEDPDNRGGGGGGGMRHRHGRAGGPEMSPEDIFNAFFGGGMPGGPMGGGGGGVHFYSTGFGPGMHFRTGGMPRRHAQQQRQQPAEERTPGVAMLMQLLPVFFFLILSFLSQSDTTMGGTASRRMAGEDQYFSLTNKVPFTNPMSTKLSKVKEIPYFVTNKFLRTYYRDRYQLAQVETMVERAYENYLVGECKGQQAYQTRLRNEAQKESDDETKARMMQRADEFELTRCDELLDLFPDQYKRSAR